MHTSLLTVNTLVTYIIIHSVCFHSAELTEKKRGTCQTCFYTDIQFIPTKEQQKRQSNVFISAIITDMFLLPVVLCNHMINELVDVLSGLQVKLINMVWRNPVAVQLTVFFSFFF